MDFFHRAMVAVANTEPDVELLKYARMVQQIGSDQTEFQFVHVLPPTSGADGRASAPTHSEALQKLRASVEAYFGGSDNVCRVLTGPRVDMLLEFAAESRTDVILVGHRRSRSGRRSLGRRLAMKAPCSLWMAPEGSPLRISRVLAAVDFSPPSAHALSFATLLAKHAGLTECTAVHVQEPTAVSSDRIVEEESRKAFDQFLAPLDVHDVQIRPRIEQSGSVSAAILRVADQEKGDLLVMGTRGRSASAAVLLGSESEQTIIETNLPLLVMKHRGERIGLLQVLLDRDFQLTEPRFG